MNTFVQHAAKHKAAYIVGLIALLIGLFGWAYSRGSFNNLSDDFAGATNKAFTPPQASLRISNANIRGNFVNGRLNLLEFNAMSVGRASTLKGWTFNVTTNGPVRLSNFLFTEQGMNPLRPTSGGENTTDNRPRAVTFGGTSYIPANSVKRYVLTAQADGIPTPATYTGVSTTLAVNSIVAATPKPKITGLPISQILGDMTPAPVSEAELTISKNNTSTTLINGQAALLDFNATAANQNVNVGAWSFALVYNGIFNISNFRLTNAATGAMMPLMKGGTGERPASVSFGAQTIATTGPSRYVLSAELAGVRETGFMGINATLAAAGVSARGAVSGNVITPAGLPINHTLGDMTPLPPMSFSVNLTLDGPTPPDGVIPVQIGDVTTFTRHENPVGVVNNSWEWHWDNTKLNCAAYPEFDSADFRCTMIAPGRSEVYITMHPIFVDGHTENVESNRFAVEVAQPRDPGALSIRSSNNPASAILVAGITEQQVAQYEFSAQGEAFDVTKLTVINDATGSFDNPVSTLAVQRVTLKYADQNGGIQNVTVPLVNGSATFNGLSPALYVPKDGTVWITILADVSNSDVGQIISGQTFRLGIQENNADNASGTFTAIGVDSGVADYNPSFSGGPAVQPFVVRFTKITVAKDGGDGVLMDGPQDLYKVKITADPARDAEISKLTFQVNSNFDNSSDSLSWFRIREGVSGADFASSEASIRSSGGTDLYIGALGGPFIHSTVAVNFTTPRAINAGSEKTFILKAIVAGANNINERVETSFSNVGSGQVISDTLDRLRSWFNDFIWSDKSFTSPTHGADTPDWTNGYLVPGFPTPSRVLTY